MSNAFLEELPYFYRDVKEFNELSNSVVKVGWEKIDQAFDSMENDQFILTSSEAAIKEREKDFDIVADPTTEPLNFRKLRLLSRMQENVPYTIRYFKKLLETLVGEENLELFRDIDNFEVEISVYVKDAIYHNEVEKMAERIVPLNMDLITSTILIREYVLLKFGSYAFDLKYKRTNKFHTASVDGHGRLTNQMVTNYGSYGFNMSYPVTNKFRTSSTPGTLVPGHEISIQATAYSFKQGLPVCGKLVAKGA